MSSIRLQSVCVTDKTRVANIAIYSTSRCGTLSGTQINASRDAPLDSASAVDSAAVGVNAPRIFNMCRRFPRSKESSFQVAVILSEALGDLRQWFGFSVLGLCKRYGCYNIFV